MLCRCSAQLRVFECALVFVDVREQDDEPEEDGVGEQELRVVYRAPVRGRRSYHAREFQQDERRDEDQTESQE